MCVVLEFLVVFDRLKRKQLPQGVLRGAVLAYTEAVFVCAQVPCKQVNGGSVSMEPCAPAPCLSGSSKGLGTGLLIIIFLIYKVLHRKVVTGFFKDSTFFRGGSDLLGYEAMKPSI